MALCNYTVKADTPGTSYKELRKMAKFLFKGSESLFTKPYELLMTHKKNEVFMTTQIFKMVA